MLHTDRYPARFLIFSLLLVLPVVRLLLDEQYGFVHVEVAAVLGLFAAAAAVLAAVTGRPLVFHTVVGALVILLSVNAVQKDLLPDVRNRTALAAVAVAVAGLMLLLKRNFFPLLAVFVTGGFIVDAGKALFGGGVAAAQQAAAAPAPYKHVLHIVLDEMIGIAGMPADCANCRKAVNRLEYVFDEGRFRLYPYAFSNYARTVDSIPSIVNNRLLRRGGEMFDWNRGRHLLQENAYFDEHMGKGYAIAAYQSDYVMYSAPKYSAVTRDYKSNSLKALHLTALNWHERARQILAIYFMSDGFWNETWNAAAPERFQIAALRVGPLAVADVWPAGILRDVRNAKRNTLFFVHLLSPHYPYVYRADGSLRPIGEWDDRLVFHKAEEAEYKAHYERYGEQVQFLAGQIASLLNGLKSLGVYDSSTIVIHGDHGSRLRLVSSPEEVQEALKDRRIPRVGTLLNPGAFRNLLSMYSTLLAVKLPGSEAAEVVNEKGSVLFFLRRDLSRPDPRNTGVSEPDLNAVYVYDRSGKQSPIPLPELWDRCCDDSIKGVEYERTN